MPSTSLDDSLLAAMEAASSPPGTPSNLGKRRRSSTDEGDESEAEGQSNGEGDDLGVSDDDNGEDTPAVCPAPRPERNLALYAKRYAASKKLRRDQVAAVEQFVGDDANTKMLKLYTQGLAIENRLEKIITAQPVFQISPDLSRNITEFSVAVLLSSKIASYKGDIPRDHVLNILKTFRYDLPPGIEYVPADWGKVVSAVGTALTQKRSVWKKQLKASFHKDGPKHSTDLYSLTRKLAKNSNCQITVPLCCRVALMRNIYADGNHSDRKFWDAIDERLEWIREKANGDGKKIVKMFKVLMKEDMDKYGSVEGLPDLEDVIDERQQRVDDVIEGVISTGSHSD
ncbi:hypothetical protein BV25DRAFT_1921676 [Artomyces pyxidatus]|uniref:Uncharacterized protein n=1 Tax=Artomyces pyxidatus TaxID=48021 RepID=A0ACB8SHA1_9AGAM|nr:hypothetical protein BV25DRAFT_1921676 [Artomyces pyxidatus]